MLRFCGELLFRVGQNAFRRRRADTGAGIGFYGLNLRKCLLLRLAHLAPSHAKALGDYALLLLITAHVMQDGRGEVDGRSVHCLRGA